MKRKSSQITKFLSLILVIVSIVTMMPVSVFAAESTNSILSGTCGENATYTYDEATKTLTISGTGSICESAFSCYDNDDTQRGTISENVETVIIEEGITEIGSMAFGCCWCTSIKLPNSLEIIRSSAFYCCYITSIDIPDTVTVIEKAAFNMCQSLVDVVLPANINVINESTFSGCGKLDNINIPTTVETIGQDAFSGCCSSSLELNIPCSTELEHGNTEFQYSNKGILGSMGYANSFCGIINVVPDSAQEEYFLTYYSSEINAGKITLNTTLSHNFLDATEKEDGTYVEICSICGEEKVVEKHNLIKIEGTEATCTNNGTKEYWYCDLCGSFFSDENAKEEITEDVDIWKMIQAEGHSYYWYHTDTMAENDFDLLCSECGINGGRAYLNSDNQYYMYGYTENDTPYHYIYDENAECLSAEKCSVDYWYSDENYHEGVCKCHLILCEEEAHNFTSKKYDVSGHWTECSECGEASEIEEHYYDENGDTKCNGCSYTRSIVESISIDKTLMSEGETATITVKVIEGYTAEWVYFYRPITNNTEVVYLYLDSDSDNTYTGTFKVDDQTESGIWQVKNLTLKNTNKDFVYLYNSNNYTGTTRETFDFSPLNFEVIGTSADVTAPVIESYSINKKTVSNGESITFSAKIVDDHLPSSFYLYYLSPSEKSESIVMRKIDDTGLYQGTLTIVSETEIGLWQPRYFSVSDTNDNSFFLYNSKVVSYASNKTDLSALNFEVIEISEDAGTNENAETFIVIFKDGYGNTLSTQKIAKGNNAVEPETPTNELYLFNGWDSEFTNITSNKVITATWILNPDVIYDSEIHAGKTFTIEVYSSASQDYSISCSDDIEFTSKLVSAGMIFTDQLYYTKKYEIEVNDAGSYLFYVKGSKASNTLTYKIKVLEHIFEDEWTVEKTPTCTTEGSKSRHCTVCGFKADITTIASLGHDFSETWMIDASPTCTTEGSKSRHCTVCGFKADITTIASLGHDFSETWMIDKKATCTTAGSKSHHCTRCSSKTDVTVLPNLGHDFSETWTIDKKATCTTDGSKSHQCTRCSAKSDVTVISKLGHNFSTKWTIDKKVTCTTNGSMSHHCARCSAKSEVTVISKLGHNYKTTTTRATTSANGKKVTKCTVCGYTKNKTIYKISSVKLSSIAYAYNGNKKTPTVTVKDSKGNKLVKGEDYKVTYSSSKRTSIGRYSVKVTFMGDYSGSKTLYFTIGPKNPSTVKVVLDNYNNATLSWSKVSGATGYKIYWKPEPNDPYYYCGSTSTLTNWSFGMIDGTKNTFKVIAYKKVDGVTCNNAGKTCSIYSLKKVEDVEVAKSGSKVKVSWDNIPGETGYQISKSTSKTGTNIVSTYKTTSGESKTISATKGKTYYYKVRAYKVVDGQKIYAPWSAPVKFVRK